MALEKKVESIFSVRNRIVYFICGICCIVASFLPYYSFYYKNYFITIKGVDVINDLKTVWIYEDKASVMALILFILPFYVMILGAIYLFRSFVTSYKVEKINESIFKAIKTITVTLTIAWVFAVFLPFDTPGSNGNYLTTVLSNIQFGFYLFVLSEIFKFFLEITVEETDLVLDTIKLNAQSEESELLTRLEEENVDENENVDYQYYITNGENQDGPFKICELKNKIKQSDYVWRKGMSEWVKAVDDPNLKNLFSDLPPVFKSK